MKPMKKQYFAICFTIMVLVNYACHSKKENPIQKDIGRDTVIVDEPPVSSPKSYPAEIDSSAMKKNESHKGSFAIKPIKPRKQKNRISPKRKETSKKGFTSIRAERRKQKSK